MHTLPVHALAAERGQQAGVNVEHRSRVGGHQARGDELRGGGMQGDERGRRMLKIEKA